MKTRFNIEEHCIPLYLNYFIIVYVNGDQSYYYYYYFNCINEITLFIITVKTSISWVSDNIISRDFNKLYRNSLNYYLIIFINIYNMLNLYSLNKKNTKYILLRAALVMISSFIHFYFIICNYFLRSLVNLLLIRIDNSIQFLHMEIIIYFFLFLYK